jgi:Ca2+-transporting ATPase
MVGKDIQPLKERARQAFRAQNQRMARQGLRVLAAAEKTVTDVDEHPYQKLTLLGLIGMHDPPRQDVPAAVQACHRAGVNVVMVTGDQAPTAEKIAYLAGLAKEGTQALQGRELRKADDLSEEQKRRLLRARVFARVSPRQKLDLIALHQDNRAVVAMTGDGVNDAPALKKADIGIAMGQRGTQVAREAADMVLKDDAFRTIVTAIGQGRVIFNNIRKFILFLLSGNVGEILIVGAAILAGAPLPLLPLQILYLNMIGDVFPALALAVGKGNPAVMRRPPRAAGEPIITRGYWMAVGGYGLIISVSVLSAFAWAVYWTDMDSRHAVTVSFLTLSFARIWHVFNMRSLSSSFFNNEITRNPFVWGAVGVCTGLLLLAVYLPGLAGILKLVPPDAGQWSLIMAFSLLPLVIGQAAVGLAGKRRD